MFCMAALHSIWASDSEVWASGDFGYMMKNSGEGFSPVWQFDTRVTSSGLFAISGWPNDEFHVVGDNGTILRYRR